MFQFTNCYAHGTFNESNTKAIFKVNSNFQISDLNINPKIPQQGLFKSLISQSR